MLSVLSLLAGALEGERGFFIFFLKAPQNFTLPRKLGFLKLRTTQLIMENHLRIPAVHFPGSACFRGFLPVNPNIFFFKGPTCIDWHR